MYEVGRCWERGEISVADEHLATAACHQLLVFLYEQLLVARPRSRSRVLLAGLEGEHHALGLRMAADVLEGAGHDVIYLGTDVPREALLGSVARFRPELVGLTATTPASAAAVTAFVTSLQSLEPGLPVLVGGQGFGTGLSAAPGVEVHRDVESIRDAVARLTAGAPRRPPRRVGATPIARPLARLRSTQVAQFEATAASLADLARHHATNAYGLKLDAMQDALTDLWNRRAFDDKMREFIEDPSTRPLSLVLIDVDNFKAINDAFGHQAGDGALQQVAAKMRQATRKADVLARLGGDEFAVLLPRTSLTDARRLAERLRNSSRVNRLRASPSASGSRTARTIPAAACLPQTSGSIAQSLSAAIPSS